MITKLILMRNKIILNHIFPVVPEGNLYDLPFIILISMLEILTN